MSYHQNHRNWNQLTEESSVGLTRSSAARTPCHAVRWRWQGRVSTAGPRTPRTFSLSPAAPTPLLQPWPC